MENKLEKFIKIQENDKYNYLQVKFYYDLGGMNYFSYTQKKRGYYLSVAPCRRREYNGYSTIETTAFTGFYQLVKAVSRQSKKAKEEAMQEAEDVLPLLISMVCEKNGLKLAEE